MNDGFRERVVFGATVRRRFSRHNFDRGYFYVRVMNLRELLTVCCFGMVSTSALAGPVDDARFVVEQHIIYGETFEKLGMLELDLVENLKPAIARLGATIIDTEGLMHEITGEFKADFLSNVSNASIEAFVKFLSANELSDLASFYRSEEGLELLSEMRAKNVELEAHPFFLQGPGLPILEHYEDLDAHIDQAALQSFSVIQSSLTMSRFAEIFENPQIIAFENETVRATVVAGLRSVDP